MNTWDLIKAIMFIVLSALCFTDNVEELYRYIIGLILCWYGIKYLFLSFEKYI